MAASRFRIGPEPMSEADMNRWLKAQMPYENLASNEEIGERARKFVGEKVTQFNQQATAIHEKWKTLEFMLRGNSLSRNFMGSWIHVPMIYNAVETLVPMIVDAIIGAEPWIQVQGRDRRDRMRARKIEAWLRYQFDLTRLPTKLEEIARAFVIYSFVALKTGWDVRYRTRIAKEASRRLEDGFPVWDIDSKEIRELAYEGNTFEIIRPRNFFCDITHTDPQEMQFIGDICERSEEELIADAELGIYDKKQVKKVLDKIKEAGQNPTGSLNDLRKQDEYSLSSNTLTHPATQVGKGQPKLLNVYECWCTWREDDDADFDEWILTICNDVPIRVQKNFNDDKHRPYAVARAAKEPWEFFNVGVLDQAIPLSIEADDNRNLGYESHRRSINPPIFTGPDSDVPDNIFNYAAEGQVIHAKDAVSYVKIPSSMPEMISFESVLARQIEQTTGAFGAFEGSTETNTATEYERKVQLRNLRNRRLVFAFSDGLRQLAEQFYANTQQFVSYRKPFRVLGADASALEIDYEITPEDLADPVDILITGPDRLQTYGLRATQITSFLQQAAVFLPILTQNGSLNVEALTQEMWRTIVGYRLGEDILRVPKSVDDAMPPEEENIVLLTGGTVETNPQDEDSEHEDAHEAALAYAAQQGDTAALKRIDQHIEDHVAQRRAKAARAAAMENPQAGPFASGQALGARHAPAEGREFQRTPDLQGDVARQTPNGETPGPLRQGAIGAPDREPSIPQSQNR